MSEEIKTESPMEGEYLALADEARAEQPADDPQGQPGAEIPTSQLIFPIVELAAGSLAPNWNLQKAELTGLAESYGAVLDKYFPNIANNMGVELNALLITAAVIGPRLAIPRYKTEPKQEPEKKPGEGDSNGETEPGAE